MQQQDNLKAKRKNWGGRFVQNSWTISVCDFALLDSEHVKKKESCSALSQIRKKKWSSTLHLAFGTSRVGVSAWCPLPIRVATCIQAAFPTPGSSTTPKRRTSTEAVCVDREENWCHPRGWARRHSSIHKISLKTATHSCRATFAITPLLSSSSSFGVTIRSVISIDFLCVVFAARDDLVGYFQWAVEVLSFHTRLHSSSIVISSRLVGTSCRTSSLCLHLRVGGWVLEP